MARHAATIVATPSPLLLLLAALVLLVAASLSEAFALPVHPSTLSVAARRIAPASSSIVSMSSSVEEGTSSSATTTTPTESNDAGSKADFPCKKYPKCNGAYLGKGCDGAGKIQGGIATFPLLGWWPIKVRTREGYRREKNGIWIGFLFVLLCGPRASARACVWASGGVYVSRTRVRSN